MGARPVVDGAGVRRPSHRCGRYASAAAAFVSASPAAVGIIHRRSGGSGQGWWQQHDPRWQRARRGAAAGRRSARTKGRAATASQGRSEATGTEGGAAEARAARGCEEARAQAGAAEGGGKTERGRGVARSEGKEGRAVAARRYSRTVTAGQAATVGEGRCESRSAAFTEGGCKNGGRGEEGRRRQGCSGR